MQPCQSPASAGRHSLIYTFPFAIPRNYSMNIKQVGVIGAGTMGNGIAHVFAKSGYQVYLQDLHESSLTRGLETIKKNLERELSKQKITEQTRDAAIKA